MFKLLKKIGMILAYPFVLVYTMVVMFLLIKSIKNQIEGKTFVLKARK